jgi:hypothetical protein
MGTPQATARLGQALFTKTQRVLLPILFGQPNRALHLRELVRQCGTGPGAVQRELARLVAAGIVRRESRGRQVCFAVDRECPLWPELGALVSESCPRVPPSKAPARARGGGARARGTGLCARDVATLRLLRQRLCRSVAVDRLIAFGSRARGQAEPDSDLDVLVVLPAAPSYAIRQIVSECAWEVGLDRGLVIAPVVVSREEWDHGPEQNSLMAQAVRREGVPV